MADLRIIITFLGKFFHFYEHVYICLAPHLERSL